VVRVGTPSAVARPDWYDRNPITHVGGWTGLDVAPHSQTPRFTYTVPAGKKAMVEILHGLIMRKTAATTLDNAEVWWQIYPGGGGGVTVITQILHSNTVGNKDTQALGPSLTLLPADQLRCYTIDVSTGGTHDWSVGYKITEFDA